MNAERLLALFERISEAPDAIHRLRRFILDLAVRGKLVEQDLEDETAVVLLAAISRDVEDAVNAGRMRNPKSITKNEGMRQYDLPANWVWTQLGRLVAAEDGAMCDGPFGSKLKTEHYISSTGYAVVRLGNIGTGDFVWGKEGHISRDHFESLRPNHLLPGDLLVAGLADPLVRCCEVPADLGPAINKADCFRVRLHFLVDRNYIRWYLNSPVAKRFASDENHGMTRERINLSNAKALPTPLPPLAEQHRIVAKVEELMALCDQLEVSLMQREQCRGRLLTTSLLRLNQPSDDPEAFYSDARFALQVLPCLTSTPAKIKQLRQTILNLAVRGKLVEQDPKDEPAEEQLERIIEAKILHGRKSRTTKKKQTEASDEADTFQLPNGWATAPLADLVTVLNGRAYKQSELLDAGTPVLRVGNLFTSNKWYYSNLELENDKYCDNGDLIFAWSASFGPFIWDGGRVIYHYHIWKLPLHSPNDLSRDYLYLYLLNKTAEIKAAGHGISMVHMTKEKMEKLEVPLPPLAEQHRIVAKVDQLMALCDQLEQQLGQAEQSRRGLLEAVLHEVLADKHGPPTTWRTTSTS
jgi:restriction endonuclease S subunit